MESPTRNEGKMSNKISAWDLIDEVLTEMNDQNFAWWSKDRIEFRNILIEEVKDYIVREDLFVTNEQPERDEETGEWL